MAWHSLVDKRINDDGVEDVLVRVRNAAPSSTWQVIWWGKEKYRRASAIDCGLMSTMVKDLPARVSMVPRVPPPHPIRSISRAAVWVSTEDGVHVGSQTHTVTIRLALLPALLPIDV